MPFLDSNGQRLFYVQRGEGHPVILIHGGCVDHRMWNEQVAPIAASYTVLRYDLRGHGQSAAPARGYALADFAADLRGLLQALGMTKPTFVGHSLGGNVAVEYALTYPTGVTSLVLVDSGLEGFGYSKDWETQRLRRRELLKERGVSEAVVRALMRGERFEILRRDPFKRELVRQMLAAWSGANWLDESLPPPSARPHTDRLKELKVPAFVVVGEHDEAGFHEIAERLTTGITVTRKAIVPEAGHLAPLDNPEAFNDLLLDFLGGAVGKALL